MLEQYINRTWVRVGVTRCIGIDLHFVTQVILVFPQNKLETIIVKSIGLKDWKWFGPGLC